MGCLRLQPQDLENAAAAEEEAAAAAAQKRKEEENKKRNKKKTRIGGCGAGAPTTRMSFLVKKNDV